MATGNKSRSTAGSSSGRIRSKKGGSGSTGSKSKKVSAGNSNSANSFGVLLAELFTRTYFGRVFIGALLLALMVIINLIVSGDRFNFFFMMLGIELVIITAVAWVMFLIRDDKNE